MCAAFNANLTVVHLSISAQTGCFELGIKHCRGACHSRLMCSGAAFASVTHGRKALVNQFDGVA